MRILPLVISLFATSVAFCQGLPSGPFIYTIGRAQTSVDPDIAVLKITVSEVNPDQSVARAKVIARSKEVFEALAAIGVPSADVSSLQVTVDSEYDYQDRKRIFSGFRLSQKIEVVARDVTRLPVLTNRLTGGIASRIDAPTVKYSKQDEIERDLMENALKDARRRAEDIARASGLKIVSVYAVSPVEFGDLASAIFGGGGRSGLGRAMGLEDGFEIRLPKIELSASANVIFTVEKP